MNIIREKAKAFLSAFKLKPVYRQVIFGLCAGALVLAILSYLSWLGCGPKAGRLIQILMGLAIAVTAVIALSNTDLPKEKVCADIRPYITNDTENWEEIYQKKDLKPELCRFFANYPDPIKSYKVQYEITNTSGFDWVKPIITFRLPPDRQAPDKEEKCGNLDEKYNIRRYRSNAFNPLAGGQLLEMVDGVVMSSTNLPHWPKGWSMTIWIRMVIETKKRIQDPDEFQVQVSINSENALGFAQLVKLDHKKLLKDMEGNIRSS